MSDMLFMYKYTLIGGAAGWALASLVGVELLPPLGPLSPAMGQALLGAGAGYYFGDMNGMASTSS